jgi:hypothetical protein
MTLNRPNLFLERLVVITHAGKVAYDEVFHQGVNIIRGKNSSGKSTISNFIFYVLGGDYHNWTTESVKCREVYAQVNLSGTSITLKRLVSEHSFQPMTIFWGLYEEAIKDSINWQSYPYKQTANKVNFSNVIFNALGFPEVRTDTDSAITIHQILRLLYIDQDTPTQSLFRVEKFDPPLTRQTIAEVLLGIYDDSLYKDRLDYRNYQKDYDSKKSQFEAVSKVYSQSGDKTSVEAIKEEIELANREINNINEVIIQIKTENKSRVTNKNAVKSDTLQKELFPLKDNLAKINNTIHTLDLDIFDSKQFIETLQKRLKELEYSILTRKSLGEIPLTHCPQCLSALETNIEEGHCILCNKKTNDESEKTHAKRLRQEMELQIKESESLLYEKEKKNAELKGILPTYIAKAKTLQKELNVALNDSQSTRDERIDTLLVGKGGVEKKIEYLSQQIKSAEMLSLLRKELATLQANLETLRLTIRSKEGKQEQNYITALAKIRSYTIEILRKDLSRQDEFKTGRLMEVDFLKDTYSLDGSNNFSASSKTYFKNAVLFAIFFASVDLDFFRYPRFILCDNMEDKGMEKERTQNFQNLIVEMSSNLKNEFQIIFTTSMIADELNYTNLCVGDEYSPDNKSLKF